MHCMKTLPRMYKCILDLLFTTSNLNQYRPQHGQSVIFLIWTAGEKEKEYVHGRNSESKCIWTRNVRWLFGVRLLLQLSFPQLCAESLTRGASSPPCRCAGGLPKAHHVAGTAEVHSSHLLIHLWSIHTSLVSTGAETQHTVSQKAVVPPARLTSNPVKVRVPKMNISH